MNQGCTVLCNFGAYRNWSKCLHLLVWGSVILCKLECYTVHFLHSDSQVTDENWRNGAYCSVTPVISSVTVKILFKSKKFAQLFLKKKTRDNFIKLALSSLNETVYFVLCSLELIIYFLMVFLKQVNRRTIVSANTCYNCGDEESDHNRSAA